MITENTKLENSCSPWDTQITYQGERLADVVNDAMIDDNLTAISGPGYRYSYRQLNIYINKMRHFYIELGFIAGDRIVLVLNSSLEFVIAYFAAHRAGLVVIPLNPLLGSEEIGYIVNKMMPAGVISLAPNDISPIANKLPGLIEQNCPHTILAFFGDFNPQLFPLAIAIDSYLPNCSDQELIHNSSPEDEVLILFTSGTSGQPKGVSICQRAVMSNVLQANAALRFSSDDTLLCPLPLAHVFGQIVLMLGGLVAGSHLVLVPKPTVDNVFDAMLQYRPTFMAAVPTTYSGLSQIAKIEPQFAKRAAERLRMSLSGGSNLPNAIAKEFEDCFNKPLFQGYGMTEVACCISLDDPLRACTGVAGYILPTIEYRVTPLSEASENKGELEIRGRNVFNGYYIDGELNPRKEEEWFPTGDLVRVVGKRQLKLYDRKKEMIIRGGYNIYPSEVEKVLVLHPSILLAAVCGVADEQLGQEVAAYVELVAGNCLSIEEIATWCKNRIALYKYPRKIAIMEKLPVNPTGKILKSKLEPKLLKTVVI